jgi:hypothetical protein
MVTLLRALSATVAVLGVAVTSACDPGSSAGPPPSGERSAVAAHPRTPVPDAAARVRALSADVDGDGRADAVRVRWLHRSAGPPFRGSVVLSVRFAGGTARRIVIRVADWIDLTDPNTASVPASAAAQLDGRAGDEVIVDFWNTPASFAGYRVIADHDDRLVSIPAPDGDRTRGWWVGASLGTGGHTYGCPDDRITAIVSKPTRAPGMARIVRTSYIWRSGGWHALRQVRTVDAAPAGGWACGRLADWPG